MTNFQDDRQRQFNEYLRDGITAAKNGQKKLAQSLLNRAILLNNADARPYVWLSVTTDDLREQMDYLEMAVALDPENASARRFLALLKGKIDSDKLVPEGLEIEKTPVAEPLEAQAQPFLCPSCGGRMVFSTLSSRLTCEFCGYAEGEQAVAASEVGGQTMEEQVLDFVIPTTTGHQWARVQQKMSCEQCGALILLPPGDKSTQCAYCGSNQIVLSGGQADLIEPHRIALMSVDEQQARKNVHRWLGTGLFSPDHLHRATHSLQLRPGYYSFWNFDGAVEISWSCEVAEESGGMKEWTPVSGTETRFFNDVLMPGVKAIELRQLKELAPFDLSKASGFKPDYLVGWPAILYDRPLSDISLLAREEALRRLRPEMYGSILVGREKRNLLFGGSNWSGITFQHILLPLWVGCYLFQGREYRLLMNGQTGKISGEKPKDSVKLVLIWLTVILALAFIVLLAISFSDLISLF